MGGCFIMERIYYFHWLEINIIRSWQLILERICFSQKLMGSNHEKISVYTICFLGFKVFLSECSFKSKMRQKRRIFTNIPYQYLNIFGSGASAQPYKPHPGLKSRILAQAFSVAVGLCSCSQLTTNFFSFISFSFSPHVPPCLFPVFVKLNETGWLLSQCFTNRPPSPTPPGIVGKWQTYHTWRVGWTKLYQYWPQKEDNLKKVKKEEQAGAELCQAQHSLSLDTN